MKNQFIVTIICYDKGNLSADSILFDSFEEALSYAQKDAEYYKHLTNEYNEEIGIYKHVAQITMKGKYICKKYCISRLEYDRVKGTIRPTTYPVVDFLPNDKMI